MVDNVSGKMDKYYKQHEKQCGLSTWLCTHAGFVKRGAGVTAGSGQESHINMIHLYLGKDTDSWDLPYHLATDCGLQGIHQLCGNSNEIVVVCLDLIEPFQVCH